MVDIAAIVLAAGRASRFGAGADDSKVVAILGGVPLVVHVVSAAMESRASHVIVVTGHAAARTQAALEGRPVAIVHNPDYAAGMATSLKAGIAALPNMIEGALILLGDMPLVASTTLDSLIEVFTRERPMRWSRGTRDARGTRS